MAQASNNFVINISTPADCTTTGGTDVINANITQTGSSSNNCSNSSSYEAMLRLVLTNSLKAVEALQNPQLSAAGAEGGDGLLGGAAAGTMGDIFTTMFQHNHESTNATNKVIETTDYSSLQECRSHAQNMIQININDCQENRVINTKVQQSATAMLNCVNNSNANVTMATSIANTLTSSQSQTGLWENLVSTIGNVIMLIALIGAVASVLLAFAAALTTKFTTKGVVAADETRAAIAQSQADAAAHGASVDVVRAIGAPSKPKSSSWF
jgi:hypothetical protein